MWVIGAEEAESDALEGRAGRLAPLGRHVEVFEQQPTQRWLDLHRCRIERLALEGIENELVHPPAQLGELVGAEGNERVDPAGVLLPCLGRVGCGARIIKSLMLGAIEALDRVVERAEGRRFPIWPHQDQRVGPLAPTRLHLPRKPLDQFGIGADAAAWDGKLADHVDQRHQQTRRELAPGEALLEISE